MKHYIEIYTLNPKFLHVVLVTTLQFTKPKYLTSYY